MSQSFGPYEVLEQVAEGSTARVFRARHRELDRPAAIKELMPSVRERHEVLERLRAEAAALSRLSHPNIVGLYDYVEDGESAWLAEQWVDGVALEQLLRVHRRLTAEQALGVVRGAVTGLAHAHAQGLVHRDVSAANILADMQGTSMLVDFGLAAPAGAGPALGTPAFLSPEAGRGESVGKPGDVYSAAAVLYFLLTGEPVFSGSAGDVVHQHMESPPPALEGHGDLMADLVRRSLAKDPEARPPDAAAFLRELEQAAEARYGAGWLGRASIAGLVAAAAAGVPLAATGAGAALETVVVDRAQVSLVDPVVRTTRRFGTKAALGVGAAVVAVGVVATVVVANAGEDSPSGSSAVDGSDDDPDAAVSEEPTVDPVVDTVPTGRWRIDGVLLRTNIPWYKPSLGKVDSNRWKFLPECDDADKCGGRIESNSGNTFRYRWDGSTLVVIRPQTKWVDEGPCYETLEDGTVTDTKVPGTHYKNTSTVPKTVVLRGREGGTQFTGTYEETVRVTELVDCEEDGPPDKFAKWQWTVTRPQ